MKTHLLVPKSRRLILVKTQHLIFTFSKIKQFGHLLGLFFLLSKVSTGFSQTTLLSWDVNGQASYGTQGLAPITSHPKLENILGFTRASGVGTTGTAAANAWGGVDWASTEALGITNNKFITFGFKPKDGYAVSLTSINPFGYRRSTTGTPNGTLQYTIDGGTTYNGSSANLANAFTSTGSGGATLSLSLTDTDLSNQTATIGFRLIPYGASSSAGTFYIFDTQSGSSDFSVNGRVLGSSVITLASFSSCEGFSSVAQNFTIQGDGLTAANVVVSAPTGYEISTDNTTYSASLNITPASGSVNQIVYVRLKSTASAGANSGKVTITGGGFTSTANLGVAVSGTVNALPTGTLTFTESSGTTNNDGTVCSGDAVNFTAPTGYANYNFKIGGVSMQNGVSNTYAPTFTASGNVTVEITSAVTCTATLNTVAITVGTCGVKNTTTNKNYVTIQAGVNDALTLNGQTLEVASGTYNEQVLVNKELNIKGVGLTKPIVNFTGTPTGKLTLFDVSKPNVTIENFTLSVDVTKLGSAVLGSDATLSALTVKDNNINPYRSAAGTVSFGLRNAISINYGAYRVGGNNPIGLLIQGNTISYNNGVDATAGTADDAGFRAGVSSDVGVGTFTGNTIQSISQDLELRFSNPGNLVVTNNNINGGGVEISEHNTASGTVTVSGNTFNGTAGNTYTNILRLKNNQVPKPTTVSGNTFTNTVWAASLENYRDVTFNNNTFTPLSGSTTYQHIAINTKLFSSGSATNIQTAIDGTFTNNTFNGSGATGGKAFAFYNQDSDNAAFGTFTVGTSGNENNFNTGIQNFIFFDGSTGNSVAPITPMAPWAENLDASFNKFDVSGSLKLPSAMTFAERTSLENALTHKPDNPALGLITYFKPVHNLTQNTYFSTIQPSIAAAVANDVIELSEWTFAEGITIDKPLTIQGVDSSSVILDGATIANANGITIANGIQNVIIKNLKIKNFKGANPLGSGIFGIENSNLMIDAVVLDNNQGRGGVYLGGGSGIQNVTIKNSISKNNVVSGSRGIVIWDGFKQNITITGNKVYGNNCCGIELQDGSASGVTVTGNTVVSNFDNGIGLIGLTGPGANIVSGNIVINNGRFGMEIKNPNGNGLSSGAGSVVIDGNTVSRTIPIGLEVRDIAGIAVFRRGVTTLNIDVPQGVVVKNNTVSGYTQPSNSDGFGIVVEGINHTVATNTVSGNDVGIQRQAGHLPYPGDGDQSNLSDTYFGRGNSPVSCGITLTGNTLSSNGVNTRDVGNSDGTGIVTNTNTNKSFCTIQAAINDISTVNGHIITVTAGTYAENIIVSKSVEIRGPNYGISPNGGTRVAEAIVVPAVKAIDSGEIIHVAASDVKVDGFTINGDNLLLNSGFTSTNAADIDAAEGVTIYEDNINNLTVTNNIFKNLSYFGVSLYGGSSPVPTSGHSVANNKFQDFGTYDATSNIDFWGGGVLLYNNQYTAITDNVMTNLRLGVQTGNFYQANTGTIVTQTISNNNIQVRRIGIFHNLHYATASPFTLTNNTITGLANTNETGVRGILLGSLSVNSTLNNNNVNLSAVAANSTGVEVWNVKNTTPASIVGGTLSNVNTGIFVNNYDGYSSDATDGGHATISGVTINPNTSGTGIRLFDNPLSTHVGVEATIGSGVIINNGTTGIVVENTSAKILSPLGNLAFVGQTGDYIKLVGNANNIDATTATFGGKTGATATLAQNFAIEDKILHKLDNAALGFVSVKANNDYVTTNSGSIQRGVDAASNGYSVNVNSGTYNEQVLVNKEVSIKGKGATKPIVNFTGTPALASGKMTAFEITVPNVTIDSLEFRIDISKIGSAIVTAGAVNNLKIQNNNINPYRSSGTTLSFGTRNAVNINYGAFRISSTNPTGILAKNNVIAYSAGVDNTLGNADDAGFRAGFAMDEGTGNFMDNTIQTISQDIEVRFTNSANNINITNNNINGGGVNFAAPNITGGTLTIAGNTFNGTFSSGVPNANLLRVKDNIAPNTINTIIQNNTFVNHVWGLSLENYGTVTVNNNTFTPLASSTMYHHITVNTKENASSSATVLQTAINGTFTNNTFNGSGTAGGTGLLFLNHDNDNATYGTFTVGMVGNENIFNSGIANFIAFDGQTGSSDAATFPTYPSGVGTWTTTMACWNQDVDVINNKFDVGSGLQLPTAMNQANRVLLEGGLYHKKDNACLGKMCLPSDATFSSTSASVCAGSSTNLVATIVSATGPFTLIYTDGTTPVTVTGYVSGTNIPITPSATKTYSIVSITDAIGCISTTGFTGTPTITVNQLTGVTTFTVGATTVCQDAADETYTATAANSTSIVYSVLPVTAGVINASTGVMNWDVAFSGTATITATATGLCGTTTADRIVTVNPKTGVTTFTAGATTVCQDAPDGTYTATAANSTSIVYSVLPVTAGVINATTGVMNWDVAFSGTATIKATATGLCGITTANRVVIVRPLPTVYNVSGTGSICSGVASPILLSGSNTGINYKLKTNTFGYLGSVLAGTGNGLSFTPPSTPTGTYFIEATNATTGCISQMNGTVATVIATTPTISVTSQTNVSCKSGSDGKVTVLASAGTGSYNYSFNGGTTQASGTFIGNTAGTYPIVANDITSGCSASINVTLTEPATLPSVTVAVSGTACTGNTVTLTATATGGTPLYIYSWNNAGGSTSSTLSVTTTSTNTLLVADSKGCVVPTVTTTVTFNTPTPPTITGATTVCSGSTISLATTGGGTYAWSGPNSFTSTSASISIANATVSNSGTYIVTVTDANSCIASSSVSVTVNPIPATPTPQANANIPIGGTITLTATGCSGTLKWYKSADNSPVTMPVSPTVATNYYAKCEQTTNSVTCESAKSADVTVTVGDIVISIITGGTWNNPLTWDVGRVPLATDKVIIDTNHNVIITDMNATAKRLEYRTNAKVTFGNPATKLTIQGL